MLSLFLIISQCQTFAFEKIPTRTLALHIWVTVVLSLCLIVLVLIFHDRTHRCLHSLLTGRTVPLLVLNHIGFVFGEKNINGVTHCVVVQWNLLIYSNTLNGASIIGKNDDCRSIRKFEAFYW